MEVEEVGLFVRVVGKVGGTCVYLRWGCMVVGMGKGWVGGWGWGWDGVPSQRKGE